MNVVVDTNIVFSAMLNTNGKIANILSRRTTLRFYSPTYLLLELSNHQGKLSKKLNLDSEQFLELQHIVTRRINFVEEEQISTENWMEAEKLTSNIDMDDIAFVAMAQNLSALCGQEIRNFQTH